MAKRKTPTPVFGEEEDPNISGPLKSVHGALIQLTQSLKIQNLQILELTKVLLDLTETFRPLSQGFVQDRAPKPIPVNRAPVQSSDPSNRASKLELD